ncbi:MAG: hypothetical protein AAFP13_14940 [Pseudomonadota bacterium]
MTFVETYRAKYDALSGRGKVAVATAGLVLLAACGSSGISGIATLGSGFVAAFNADPNDAPVDASAVGLTPDPSADPFNP